MVKKGKYKLFSYIIDGFLIYYKSFNKNNKFIAFAAIQAKSFNPIILLMNEFLRKRFIHYYSIQVDSTKRKQISVILNFEDKEKDRIKKIFNIIYQRVYESQKSINFLENSKLETFFLKIIFKNSISNINITENSGALLIRNEERLKKLTFYIINLNFLEKKNSFLDSILNLIQNYNLLGYFIFHFQINDIDEIQIYPYFVGISNKINLIPDIAKKVNNFFNNNILKKQDVNTKKIFNYLWRFRISNDAYLLKRFYHLFITREQFFLPLLLEFNSKFEQNLINKKVEFIRLNNKLLLVEQTFLIVILPVLDSNYIQRIIKKYYLKYIIHFFLLNKLDYKKLSQIKDINKLKNIKIINSNNLSDFDFNIFKNGIF